MSESFRTHNIILSIPRVETKPNQFNRKARGIFSVLKMLWIEWKWDERAVGSTILESFLGINFVLCKPFENHRNEILVQCGEENSFQYIDPHTPSLCSTKKGLSGVSICIFSPFASTTTRFSPCHTRATISGVSSLSSTTRSSCCGRLKYLNGFDERSYT